MCDISMKALTPRTDVAGLGNCPEINVRRIWQPFLIGIFLSFLRRSFCGFRFLKNGLMFFGSFSLQRLLGLCCDRRFWNRYRFDLLCHHRFFLRFQRSFMPMECQQQQSTGCNGPDSRIEPHATAFGLLVFLADALHEPVGEVVGGFHLCRSLVFSLQGKS